jgi:hypothetical protein
MMMNGLAGSIYKAPPSKNNQVDDSFKEGSLSDAYLNNSVPSTTGIFDNMTITAANVYINRAISSTAASPSKNSSTTDSHYKNINTIDSPSKNILQIPNFTSKLTFDLQDSINDALGFIKDDKSLAEAKSAVNNILNEKSISKEDRKDLSRTGIYYKVLDVGNNLKTPYAQSKILQKAETSTNESTLIQMQILKTIATLTSLIQRITPDGDAIQTRAIA